MTETMESMPEKDRRRKSRRKVILTQSEREELDQCYIYLSRVLHTKLRVKNIQFSTIEIKNKDCNIPSKNVQTELKHIFNKDWKCTVSFDINKMIIQMMDLR